MCTGIFSRSGPSWATTRAPDDSTTLAAWPFCAPMHPTLISREWREISLDSEGEWQVGESTALREERGREVDEGAKRDAHHSDGDAGHPNGRQEGGQERKTYLHCDPR